MLNSLLLIRYFFVIFAPLYETLLTIQTMYIAASISKPTSMFTITLCPKNGIPSNAIESVKVRVLSPDVIESFLEDKGITGIQAQLYSEFLKEFIAFQNELAEYEKVDFIIGAIDSYSEAEFDMLHKQAQEKSALKADKLLQST